MDDEFRTLVAQEIAYGLTSADIKLEMPVSRKRLDQRSDYRLRAGLIAEELPPHVVVEADNVEALFVQQSNTLRANQAARSGDKGFHENPIVTWVRVSRKCRVVSGGSIAAS